MTYRRGPEYQPNLRLGTRFAVIGLAFTAACKAEIQATPTSEIFPTQPRAPEVIPKPTEILYVGVGMNQSEIIREVNGRIPPGAGGIISTENINTVSLDDRIHRALLQSSLAPVHENRVISRVVNRPDGGKECYPIMPDVLFNPYLPEGVEERDRWLAANNTFVSYGDSLTREVRFKGLRTLSLRPTSKDVFCVSAVVNSDDNPFRDESGRPVNDGVVLNVLMDREGNIYGTLPGIYGANDTVEFNAVDNKVYVNGVEVWHVGDRMAELVVEQLASLPFELEEGYELVNEGVFSVVAYQGQPIVRFRESDLTKVALSNEREIYKGGRLVEGSRAIDQLPVGSEIVFDPEGYPAVLSEGRIAGVFYQGELLMMPGLERWGSEEIQVVINEGTPRVTSLRGTELYSFEEGRWNPTIGPNEVTEFTNVGQPITTGRLVVGGPAFHKPNFNVGELGKIAEIVVKIENPEPYSDFSLYGPHTFEGVLVEPFIVEGVIWSPDGQPTMVRIPIYPDYRNTRNISYGIRTEVSKAQSGGNLPIDEFLQLIRKKKYVYFYMHFGLIESKVPQQYSDSSLYQMYRSLESSGVLDFLEYRSRPSPYVMPPLATGGVNVSD